MKPLAIEHYIVTAKSAFAANNIKNATEDAQRVLRLVPGQADALHIVDSIHDTYVAAAQDALAVGDAATAMEQAQNAINLKGRDSIARELLIDAKTLNKAQNNSVEADAPAAAE